MADDLAPASEPKGSGRLAQNILYFARALRAAGLPVGPGSLIDAVRAVEAAGLGDRADFRATLRAVFVKKHEQTLIFEQAFDIFWRRRGLIDKLIALMSPIAEPPTPEKARAPAGATRVADAMFKREADKLERPQIELDYRLTMSTDEVLQRKDFAQMTADEIATILKGMAVEDAAEVLLVMPSGLVAAALSSKVLSHELAAIFLHSMATGVMPEASKRSALLSPFAKSVRR